MSMRTIERKCFTNPRGSKNGPCEGLSPPAQAQRFLTFHGLTQHFLRFGRHLLQMAAIQPYWVYRETGFEIGAVTSSPVPDPVFPGSKIPGV